MNITRLVQSTRTEGPEGSAKSVRAHIGRVSGVGWHRRVLATLILLHLAVLMFSALVHSPTLNEPGHLVAGLYNWKYGQFNLYRVNPPLARMVASLPVLAVGCKEDWSRYREHGDSRAEFPLGRDFILLNRSRSFFLFSIARLATLPFCIVGAVVCYLWARDLFGTRAGLAAAAFWCLSPAIAGHGALITADATGTAVGAAASYAYWRWLRQSSWGLALLAGALLGLSLLTKMTFVVLIPLWPLLWLATSRRASFSSGEVTRRCAMIAACLTFGIWILNTGYGFEGSFTPLGNYSFASRLFSGLEDEPTQGIEASIAHGERRNRFASTFLARVLVPLPKDFLLGVDAQQRDFEYFGRPSYLRGEFRNGGWWYYYLYAVTVKEPLGNLVIACLVVLTRVSRIIPGFGWRDELVLISPALVIFSVVSSNDGFSQHMRYALPSFPYAYIWIAQFAAEQPPQLEPLTGWGRWHLPAAWACLVWSAVSSLSVVPHSLAYFNELAGGPTRGSEHLIHSNIDWGQDLLYLRRWLEKHPEAHPLRLAFYGECHPSAAGIVFEAPQPGPGLMSGPGRFTGDYREFKEAYRRYLAEKAAGENVTAARERWLGESTGTRTEHLREGQASPSSLEEAGDSPPPDWTESVIEHGRAAPNSPDIDWLRPGWYAISANLLRGYGTTIPNDSGFISVSDGAFAHFQCIRPVDRVGYSIYVYRITESDVVRMRRDLAAVVP